MPGQFWVKTIRELKKKSWWSKEKGGFLLAFTLPVPLFTLRIYISSTWQRRALRCSIDTSNEKMDGKWVPTVHFTLRTHLERRHSMQSLATDDRCVPLRHRVPPWYSPYYLTLVSSSLAFRVFYPKSQQSVLKAPSLYPKIIISYSSKLEQLCIQWRRQKRKRSQIIWIYLTARWANLPEVWTIPSAKKNTDIRLNSKYLCFIDFFWSNYPFLITFKRCLLELLHHQYLHQFRDVYFKMHFCIPNMTLPVMWNEAS